MNLLNLKKTFLQGKLLLTLTMMIIASIFSLVNAQTSTSNCKTDFEFKVDHNTLEAKFSARSSHSPAAYYWELSDGSRYKGQSFSHTFSAPGEYKVCLKTIAFDSSTNQRCTSSTCKAVELVNCKRLEAKFGYEIKGLTIVLKGTSNSNHASYGYKLGDGTVIRGETAKHTYAKPGVYEVCFIAVDSLYGCRTEVCQRVLIDPCDLRAKFDFRQSGHDFKFFAKASDSNARFVWDFGDGSTGTGDEIKHSYQRPGNYEVCLKVYAKNGNIICDTKICEKVTIPNTGCDLEAKFDFRQEGNDFKFFAKANQEPARFVWDFGDGQSGYGDETKHSYSKPGVYEVCLTVYSTGTNTSSICSTKLCKRVLIEEDKCDLRADYRFVIDGNNLKLEAKANQDSVHFFWSFGDMNDGTGQAIKHEYRKPGVYEVCLIVFNPKTKCKVCVCKRIVIEKECNLKGDFQTRVDSDKLYVKARSNGAKNHTTYYWDFGDGSKATGAKARHQYTQRGVYVVTLVIADARRGCRIKIEKKVAIGVRNTTNQNQISSNAAKRVEKPTAPIPVWNAKVSPSPAIDKIAITSDDKDLSKVIIYGANGAVVKDQTITFTGLDITDLTKGYYYAHVYANDGSVSIVKFIKQ